MVQDDRSSQGQKSFDFNSERGVRELLMAVRASELDARTRNEIRDLVFQYANGGGDQAIRNVLEERIATYNIVPVVSVAPTIEAKETPAPVPVSGPGFASSRPAPVFRPSVVSTVKDTPAPAPAVESVSPSTPITPVMPVLPKEESITQPQVSQPAVTATQITPTIPVVPAPEVPKEKPVAPVVAPAVDVIVSKPAPVNPPQPVPPPGISLPALERIRVIKADVNSRVGNPVNLVDIDNSIGREYMTALLEAMKQLNGGSETAVASAMQRLESVYSEVKNIIDRGVKPVVQTPTPTPTPQPTPIASPTPSSPVAAVTTNESEEQPMETSPTVSVVKPIVPVMPDVSVVVEEPQGAPIKVTPVARVAPLTPITPVAPITRVAPVQPIAQSKATPIPTPYHAEAVEEGAADRFADTPISMPNMSRPKIEIRPPVEAATAASAMGVNAVADAVQITSTRFNVTAPVASATPLRTIDELPTASSIKTSVTGDPLYTREVDDGLQQLLVEWSLFKKSGLFGTGPNGREHPLFKKIAGLQIPLLLSGRFEGSTQEIKQSITDYMNGWRYEQGIVYEEGETFEVYLRRVIRHIIDWQTRKRGT